MGIENKGTALFNPSWYIIDYFGIKAYIHSRYVTEHKHDFKYDYQKETDTVDVCTLCGWERLHKSKHTQYFVSRIDRLGAYNSPRHPELSTRPAHTFDKLDPIYVSGIIRNEDMELWLKVSDECDTERIWYVPAVDTALDFDKTVDETYNYVNPEGVSGALADIILTPAVKWLKNMYSAFKDEGRFDLKSLELLGNSEYYYIFSNGIIQSNEIRLNGKQLGNIQYGVVCARSGIKYKTAIRFPSAEALIDFISNAFVASVELGFQITDSDRINAANEARVEFSQCNFDGNFHQCDDDIGLEYTWYGYQVENNRGYGLPWNLSGYTIQITQTNGYTDNSSDDISISSVVAPDGTLPYGQPFNLRGVISSATTLTNVTAYIYNSADNVIAHYSVNPGKTVYNIYSDGLNFDSQFRFGTLASGSYRYVVSASNSSRTEELINSLFSVDNAPQSFSATRYEDCYVSLKCPTTRAVNLYVNPTDSSRFTYFSKGQEPISYRRAYMSDGSTWYEVGANHNGQEMKLWLKYESDIIITDLSTPSYNPPEEIHQSVEEDSSPDWSSWSDTFASPSNTLEVETRRVVDVEGHTEYRYGRWIGPTVNWCKEYGQSKNGGNYSIQYSDWSAYRAYDTGTNWTCGCFDSQHSSHIGSIGPDSRGYPMWRKYNVSGYGNPDFFWEETRWVDTTYKTQYRTRRIELPLTLQVTLMLYDQNSIDTKLICTEGQPYGELPNPARDGYTFDGWYTLEIGGDRITASSIFGKESAQILFAHWTPVPPKIYTVSFDTNGGYGDTTSIYVIENETYGALPTPVRTDYSFDGWFTSSVGGSLITSSTPVNLSGPQTLYAHWTKDPVKTFTVSFDSVGGTVNTSSIKVTNGETYGTLPLPQKQGYTFNGWYTSESVQILSSTVVNLSGNQTLYAHWTRIPVKSFTVSFNPEGGTVSTSSITVTNGEAYGTMPLPQKQGYAFNGWYTNDSVQILSSTIVNLSGNQTLYAHWTKNETTMNFVDVSPYNYFYDAVSWAVENHVTKGTTNTTFSPHATCTKAHIITFLWRAFGSPEPTINKTFVDVDDGKYYAKATVWAYEKGLVSGDTFGGGNLCTRASAVLFLWQIAGSPEAEEYTFDDVLQDAKYADAVSWAVSEGITNGTTKTTFDPHQICSRGHIVTFLWRYFVQ